jgi:peptidoglycan lytic transglycosylase G
MSSGPPPVPGERTPEEREAARKARQARRSGRPPDVPAPGAGGAESDGSRDWLAEAEQLTGSREAAPPSAPPGGGSGRAGALPTARRGSGPRWGRIAALVIVALVVAGLAWFALNLLQPFKGDGEGTVRVVIPQGASLGDIAELLEKEGVVDSSTFFALRARIAGRSGDLKPGPYTLQSGMAHTDVLDALEQGVPPNVVRITIPEGLPRAQIAPMVERLRGNYRRATRRSRLLDPRDYKAGRATSLEGFLFPATYELKKGQPVRKLVNKQLRAFKENFAKVDLGFASRKNLTPYDVLIIASLVEREAQVAKERPIIASVIYNRLKHDIRLDIDATTRFAVGNWARPLRVSELENPSPYNTRVHSGLPPGPIGNPGLASIRAAARPAKTGFLFYVVKPGTCGRHNFAETDAEHQRYVAEYDRARAERGGESPTNC